MASGHCNHPHVDARQMISKMLQRCSRGARDAGDARRSQSIPSWLNRGKFALGRFLGILGDSWGFLGILGDSWDAGQWTGWTHREMAAPSVDPIQSNKTIPPGRMWMEPDARGCSEMLGDARRCSEMLGDVRGCSGVPDSRLDDGKLEDCTAPCSSGDWSAARRGSPLSTCGVASAATSDDSNF